VRVVRPRRVIDTGGDVDVTSDVHHPMRRLMLIAISLFAPLVSAAPAHAGLILGNTTRPFCGTSTGPSRRPRE
jgi:hypothetical protein